MRNAFRAQMSALMDLGRADLKAIAVVALTYAVNTAGDTDYRANHAALRRDAGILFGGTSNIDDNGSSFTVLLIQTVLAWQVAFDGDATLSTDVNTLLNLARDLRSLPEETLNRILFFLQYMMSV